jgi:DNA-binding CsgD family transcriptional regulator
VLVEVSGHHWAAGDLVEVVPAAIAAGDALYALGATDEADTHFGWALTALEQLGDAAPAVADPVGLLLRAADAAYLAEGGQPRSAELAERAVAHLDADIEPVRAAEAQRMLGRNCWAAGRPQEALDALRHAAALLPADPPTAELAAVVAEEARLLMLSSHDMAAIERCREAIRIAQRAGARVAEGHARCTLGCSLASLGDTESGIAEGYAALALAEETGELDLLQRVYMNLTHILMNGGDLERAVALTTAADAEGTLPFRASAASTNVVEALLMLGRDDEADAIIDELEYVGRASCAFGPHGARAEVMLARGDLGDAELHIREAAALTDGIDTVQVRGSLLLLEAKLALERSAPSEAFAHIEEALALAAGTDDHALQPEFCAVGARALADGYELDRARGRTVELDKLRRVTGGLVAEASRHADALSSGGSGPPPRTLGLLATTRAEASRITGSDPELWNAAADCWAAAHERPMIAYCLWRASEAELGRRGSRANAQQSLQEAWDIATDIGRPRPIERIEQLAQRAGITLDREPRAAPSARETAAEDLGLTPREAEVLDHLARGRTDGQIAEDLFISKKTASVHVSNILRKLDVASRVDAGEIGRHAGLGDD